jgi:hypothetical protein
VSWRWSPAGGLLVAGAFLVAVTIMVVWQRRATPTVVGLLAVLAGAVRWSVCSALEPVAVLLLLAGAGTHDLVRSYPAGATAATRAAESGPPSPGRCSAPPRSTCCST